MKRRLEQDADVLRNMMSDIRGSVLQVLDMSDRILINRPRLNYVDGIRSANTCISSWRELLWWATRMGAAL